MDYSNFKEVKITHIINPNRFYCCDLSKPTITEVLRDLEKSYPVRTEYNGPLIKSDLVCYKQPKTGQKWIRATIDDFRTRYDSKRVAILWADDYGKPFSTVFCENLVRLPYDHIFNPNLIFHAGLAVHPAKLSVNCKTNRHEMFVQTEWCEDSLTFFKKCVQEASTLYFRKATDIFDQEIAFGDLVAKKPNGEIYEIGAKLCEFKFALAKNESGERFLHVFNRSLSAVIDRWDDNLRSQNILAQCDTLLVTEIAEPQAIEDTKIREMTIDLKEISHALEECTMVNNSIYRVNNWIKTRKNPRTAVLQSSNVSLPLTGVAALKPSSQIIGNYESKPLCPPSSKSVPVSPITQEHPVIHPPGHLSSTMYLDKNFDLSSDAKAQEPFFDKLGSKRHSSPPEQTKLLKNLADTQKEVDEKEKNKADSPPVEKHIENWMELLEDNQYHVVVTAFGSCKSFYVQVVDNSSNWTELTKMLSNLRNLQPILSPKAGMMCIVRFEGEYHRAKIIRDSETTIICFCVDTGETVYFHLEPVRVYEISPELLKFMPFQAINCRLYGVKVPTDASLTNFVHRKVIMRMVEQRILVKQSIQNPDKIPWGLEGVNSYDVILFQARELRDEIIEDVLVNLQLADYDF